MAAAIIGFKWGNAFSPRMGCDAENKKHEVKRQGEVKKGEEEAERRK